MSWFRRRPATSREEIVEVDAHLARELAKAEESAFTGRLDIVDKATGGHAEVSLFRGAPYAVALEGYTPDVPARLVASGRVHADDAAGLPAGPEAGREAVRRGWLDAEELGDLHREIVVASLGAVARCSHSRITRVPDAVTDAYCTLPLPAGPLMDSLAARDTRLQRTWAGIAGDEEPSLTGMVPTGAEPPVGLQSPEVRGLLGALAPRSSVDEAARRTGFTRAEAVHLLGLLAAAGVVRLDPQPVALPPAHRLQVPEEFGRRRVHATTGITPR